MAGSAQLSSSRLGYTNNRPHSHRGWIINRGPLNGAQPGAPVHGSALPELDLIQCIKGCAGQHHLAVTSSQAVCRRRRVLQNHRAGMPALACHEAQSFGVATASC